MRTIALCRWALAALVVAAVTGCSSAERSAQPVTTAPAPEQGVATTAADAGAADTSVAGTGDPSCAPDTDGLRVAADVDGDGVDDEVLVAVGPDGSSVLLVCTIDAPAFNLGGANKPLDAYVIDVETDGTDELLVGGPSGAGPFGGSVVRFSAGEWSYDQITLEVVPGEGGRQGKSFGCVDLDGDGFTELVTLLYQLDGATLDSSSEATWQRFPAGQEDGPPEAEGTFDAASKRGVVEVLMNGTCGDDVVIDLAALS